MISSVQIIEKNEMRDNTAYTRSYSTSSSG